MIKKIKEVTIFIFLERRLQKDSRHPNFRKLGACSKENLAIYNYNWTRLTLRLYFF